MILKREDEFNILQNEFLKQNSSLIFLFGRKQIGKTTFLKEYVKDKTYLYFSCFEVLPHILFQLFFNQIKKLKDIKEQKIQTFEELIVLLSNLNFSQKTVLIFDDFQSLLKVQKNALTIFMKYWHEFLKYKNIQIVFASSINFSSKKEKEILKEANKTIFLNNFDCETIKTILPNIAKEDFIKLYAIFGTNLNYIKKYDTQISFRKNLEEILLNSNDISKDVLCIFRDELSETATYNAILYAISQGMTKIGEIAEYLNVQSTYLTRYIQKLLDLMIIKRNIPLNETINSKFGRYEIEDGYMKFWYKIMFLNSDFINLNNINKLVEIIEKELQDKLLEDAFKKYMIQFVDKNFQKIFNYEPIKILPWWNNKTYVDLVAYNNSKITFIVFDYKAISHINKLQEELKNSSNYLETSLEKNFAIFSTKSLIGK